MAKSDIVHCRICKAEIDKRTAGEDADWFKPSQRAYYHKKCYNDWKRKKDDVHSEADDEMWFESLKDFLAKDLKMAVDWAKVTSQWKTFLRQGKTAKGIYFTIRYHYEIKHGDIRKSLGGIGIVPSIYENSKSYWIERERREENICQKIEQQVRERLAQEKIVVKRKKKEKRKDSRFDMNTILEMEDNE